MTTPIERRPTTRQAAPCGGHGKESVKVAGATLPHYRAWGMRLRIFVTLKPGVLDPQGKAIEHALAGLGFGGVNEARVGKLIELDVADGTSDADVDGMCRRLLANTVIEDYRIERA
jgi:phosphoribosylformylglycinamidine synthase subunit PurS